MVEIIPDEALLATHELEKRLGLKPLIAFALLARDPIHVVLLVSYRPAKTKTFIYFK